MGTSVLVVDDDPATRGVLAAMLASEGYGVVLAADGEEALESIASFPVDLVLLDEQMPRLGGVEVLRRLRSMPSTRRLPVILVTGRDGVEERVAGLAAGADDYVIKPFEPDELVARVATQLRNHEAWQQVVDGHLEERAAIARVLQHVAGAGTLDERAAAVCDALIEVHDVGGVMLIVFDGDSSASVMGAAGDAPWTIAVGDHLPQALARYLNMRCGIGPWLEQRDGVETDGRLLPVGTAACAPIGGRNDLAGMLALTVRGDSGRVLAAAIDFATMTLALLRPELDAHRRAGAERAVIEALLADGAFTPHFQPIVDLADGGHRVVGVEALTRFADGSAPDLRFRQAAIVGLGVELERATMRAAMEAARRLPDDRWLSLNVSPTLTLGLSGVADDLFDDADRPVVLELSEQEAVHDYGGLRAALDRMGPTVRLSVDDAGSGFASLRHILALQPEFVKLDRSWVRNVDGDLPRQALITGLHSFCERTGAGLIAEGIETTEECETVTRLGVAFGQGFLLGRPEPVERFRAVQYR